MRPIPTALCPLIIGLVCRPQAEAQGERRFDWSSAYDATKAERWDEAIELWDRYLSRQPDEDFAYVYKGYCYLHSKDPERAAKSYKVALELNTRNLDARFGLCLVAIAQK